MLDPSKPCRVYFNLHKKIFSVQQKNEKGNWIVKAHKTLVALKEVKFKVSEAGRKRVIKEKKKNVHAFVEGMLNVDPIVPLKKQIVVHYNPYKFNSFFFWQGVHITPIENCGEVFLTLYENKPEIYAFDVDS